MATTIVVPFDLPYCVYVHSIEGRTFYVGRGLASRPFLRSQRSPAWQAAAGTADVKVTILGWYATVAEADAVERRAIKHLKPTCNLVHNGYEIPQATRDGARRANAAREWTEESKTMLAVALAQRRQVNHVGKPLVSVRCVETDKVYCSIRAAAQDLGVTEAAIAGNISGRIKRVKQLTFVKGN